MLSFEPNIVFIDDKIEEVDGILDLYRKEGIGVKYYDADIVAGDTPPESPFSNVNLVYLDLYYKIDFDLEMCIGWIDSIVPKNSFYVLVIWSKDTEEHKDEIIEGLTQIHKKPFVTFNEIKNNSYKNTDNSYKWQELKNKIDSEINNIPELNELSVWKKSVLFSSNVIIGHLTKNILPDALKKKLQKIILGHGGTYLLGEGNENEKRKVLFDAMDVILSSNSKSTRPTSDISAINKESLYNIPTFPITDIDSKLNSWFHFKLIEKDNIGVNEITPGIISLNKNSLLKKMYSIVDDPKLNPKFQFQIESDLTKIEDITVVLIRPCDYAQNKFGKNIKLLSGIKLNNPLRWKDEELNAKNKHKLGKIKLNSELPDSTKMFDNLTFTEDENDVSLIFDFRYVFSVPEKIFNDKFENLKLFNKELLSEIQVEYSSYSSRLGITQII
ncbi:hypothetical protein ABXT64_01365 [Candidatus Marifrigoribacter sp. Uisw_064]|uniref:hypothetical protein n=1 Tax=Candidatus Marifrigoribacter sp. Uisw_064 TaxID=3230970 RepID=UPI003D3ADD3C